jgi:hypothetical protein
MLLIVPQLVTMLSMSKSCASSRTCTYLGSLGIVTSNRIDNIYSCAIYSATVNNSAVPDKRQCLWQSHNSLGVVTWNWNIVLVMLPIMSQLVTMLSLSESCASSRTCTYLGSLGIVTLSRNIQLVVLLPIVPRSVTVMSLPEQCLWWYLYLLWLLGHCNLK